MKKIRLIGIVFLVVIIALSSCETRVPDISDPNPIQFKIYAYSKDEFLVKARESDMPDLAQGTLKVQIVSHLIEPDGWQLSSIYYGKHFLLEGQQNPNWEFEIMWQCGQLEEKLYVRLVYQDSGVNTADVISNSEYDSASDVYVGKTGDYYTCLINDKMFMRIRIPRGCNDFDAVEAKMLEYATKIKQIANSEE